MGKSDYIKTPDQNRKSKPLQGMYAQVLDELYTDVSAKTMNGFERRSSLWQHSHFHSTYAYYSKFNKDASNLSCLLCPIFDHILSGWPNLSETNTILEITVKGNIHIGMSIRSMVLKSRIHAKNTKRVMSQMVT